MSICAFLLSIGLSAACQPDPAAEELKKIQQEMHRQEQQADEKVLRLYRGLGDCPECGKVRIDPKTLTRKETP